MARRQRLGGSEHGGIIIHVAVALTALLSFSAFIVDYGLMWVSRRQAQNSADAGALAGAITMAFDSGGLTDSAAAGLSARWLAQQNAVWGQGPPAPAVDVVLSSDSAIPPCGSTPGCIRVDVFRGAPDREGSLRGTPLPTFFGHIIGLTQQRVRATATARVMTTHTTDCLKPWAVIDKWEEHKPVPGAEWTVESTFDKYDSKGVELTPGPNDVYRRPWDPDGGTGFRLPDDYGLQITLKNGANEKNVTSGWYLALRLDDSKGANDFKSNIKYCSGQTYTIGDELPLETEPGKMTGPTKQAVETDSDSLVKQDPDAVWSTACQCVTGGKYGTNISPRIVPLPLIDIDDYLASAPSGKSTVKVVNILGFFVEGMGSGKQNDEVIGRLMTAPSLKLGTSNEEIPEEMSFLKTIVLVR